MLPKTLSSLANQKHLFNPIITDNARRPVHAVVGASFIRIYRAFVDILFQMFSMSSLHDILKDYQSLKVHKGSGWGNFISIHNYSPDNGGV